MAVDKQILPEDQKDKSKSRSIKSICYGFAKWCNRNLSVSEPWIILLFFIPSIYSVFIINNIGTQIYILFGNFLISYILAFIVVKSKGLLRKILFTVFFVIIAFWNIVEVSYSIMYGTSFTQNIANMMMATNPEEASEFLHVYLTPKVPVTLLIVWICILSVCFLAKKYMKPKNWLTMLCLVACYCSILLAARSPQSLDLTVLGKSLMMVKAAKTTDLREYLTHPSIIVDEDLKPQRMVIILGESFSKYHSSLYGYEKCTNPRLQELCDSGKLYLFSNVISAAPSTMESIMRIFTTYTDTCSKQWYECHKLPEILNVAGYYQKWISNQGKRGIDDNVATRIGQLCDTIIFKNNFTKRENYVSDEPIPELIRQCKSSDHQDHNVDFIHLIGSHFDYSKRYPASRSYFKTNDYLDKPEHQRAILASYDNSILFNDSIVNEIIKIYSDDEAIIIYTPDHGQDVYMSNPDFQGHGIPGNSLSTNIGRQIPFMVYMTDRYKQRFPEKVNEIESRLKVDFNTTDLIYFVMDLAGIRFSETE